jgi:FMN-dependent NADH-azoreductase
VLGFVGITDVRFVRAEGLAMGDAVRAQALASAQSAIRAHTAIAANESQAAEAA